MEGVRGRGRTGASTARHREPRRASGGAGTGPTRCARRPLAAAGRTGRGCSGKRGGGRPGFPRRPGQGPWGRKMWAGSRCSQGRSHRTAEDVGGEQEEEEGIASTRLRRPRRGSLQGPLGARLGRGTPRLPGDPRGRRGGEGRSWGPGRGPEAAVSARGRVCCGTVSSRKLGGDDLCGVQWLLSHGPDCPDARRVSCTLRSASAGDRVPR